MEHEKTISAAVYCLLIVLLAFNTCWLINGDQVQSEQSSVKLMDPGERPENKTFLKIRCKYHSIR